MHLPTYKGLKLFMALLVIGAGMFLVNRLMIPHQEASPPAGDWEMSKNALTWETDHFTKDGQPFTGVAVEVHPDGTLKARECYQGGKQAGLTEEFFAGGQPRATSSFENGLLQGEKTSWNVDGSLQKKEWFEKGSLIKQEPPENPKP